MEVGEGGGKARGGDHVNRPNSTITQDHKTLAHER